MRRTKIVATLGPATRGKGVLAELLSAGVDVVRFNLSHGESEERFLLLKRVREVAGSLGRRVAVLFDTRGPEVRLGDFPGGSCELAKGQGFSLYPGDRPGDAAGVGVSHPGLSGDVRTGDLLLVDDGRIYLRVKEVRKDEIRTTVEVGGVITSRRKLVVPGRRLSLPALTEADREDLRRGVREGMDFVAVSFTQGAEDILLVREEILRAGGSTDIIAKMETQAGLDHLGEILRVADGLMVARGDLGVELPPEEVPIWQKRLIAQANRLGKPVITATQMLESMVSSPRPTRAEASDVANAILDGTDAVMLSAETATGSYPVEAVRMMARIAERAEAVLTRSVQVPERPTVTEAISHATVTLAEDLGAGAILTATQSGHTARMVSRFRPRAPILAMTTSEAVARRLQLVWGVQPMVAGATSSTDEMILETVRIAAEAGLVSEGDLVVITAGVPAGIPGTTNLLKVHTVGDVLVRGTALGAGVATGPVFLAPSPEEARGAPEGCILVAPATDREYVPAMERAAGLVVEEGGLTSHAAVVGLSLGRPVVVGAEGALGILRQGEIITVDSDRGLVYRGQARRP